MVDISDGSTAICGALTGWSNASTGTSCSSVKGNANPYIWWGMTLLADVHGGG